MYSRKKLLFCVTLLFAFPLFGCGDLVGCLLEDTLVMRTETLPNGVVGEEYNAEVKAEISDLLFGGALSIDADIDYEIEEGRLPAGLYLEPQGQTAVIRGVPEEAGTFQITIEAYSLELFQREKEDPCIEPNVFATYDIVIEEAPEPDLLVEP